MAKTRSQTTAGEEKKLKMNMKAKKRVGKNFPMTKTNTLPNGVMPCKVSLIKQTDIDIAKFCKNTAAQTMPCRILLKKLTDVGIAEFTVAPTIPTKKQYNLRVPTTTKKDKKKPKTQLTVATSKSVDTGKMWREARLSQSSLPEINSLVLAKMFSYSPWPARIVGLSQKSKRVVASENFFGTHQHGEVSHSETVRFENCADLSLVLLTKKLTDFSKAIRECELFHGIPLEKSLLMRQ